MTEAGLAPDSQLRRVKQWLSLARALAPARTALFDRIKRVGELTEACDLLAPIVQHAA